MKTTKRIVSVLLALIMGLTCFYVISFAEETEHLMEVPEGYVGVYTKDDLDNIKLDMSGKYILMNDIVFEDSDFEKGGSFYNSGKGWEPIGTSSTVFKGSFDGNGYKIENLYINDETQSYLGLFGCASNAIIKNVTLNDVSITGGDYTGGVVGCITNGFVTRCNLNGSVNGANSVGGIVGYSKNITTVSYCNISGAINGLKYVGGIVGYQFIQYTIDVSTRDTNKYNYILYSSNSSYVSAKSNVGGIVGYSESTMGMVNSTNGYTKHRGYAYVGYCSNSGDVSATTSIVGGIIGYSKGDIYKSSYNSHYARTKTYDCYNCGNITAPTYVGGIFGFGEYSMAEYCYSVGTISATSNFGGCFGTLLDEATFCYYLDESVINPACTSGILKSEDQMRKQTTYEQWSFDAVWTMSGRDDYPYPELIEVPLVLPEDFEHKHEYVSEITIPATHTSTGVMTYTCSCGDTYKETIGKIAEHKYESVVTAPTCTEQGYTTYTCECGDSYVDDYVSEKGHDEGIWSVTKPSTPTESGVMHLFCGECGFVLETKVIPALGKVNSVSVSDIALDYKASATITPTISADAGVKYTVTYSSSNPSVASVDANGKVVAGKTGSATITVTVKDEFGNTVSDTCEVKVNYNWWQWIIVVVLFGWIWY